METFSEEYKKDTYKMLICSPEDPNRCKANIRDGSRQCGYRAVEITEGIYGDYCMMHGGAQQIKTQQKAELRNYNLGKWQHKVNAFADNPQVKSLREEIGITRMLLENLGKRCKDEAELELATPQIENLIVKIEKLVVSCHRLEASTGMLLDKTSAIHIASKIVEIISANITDADIVDKIAEQIIAVIIGQKPETVIT